VPALLRRAPLLALVVASSCTAVSGSARRDVDAALQRYNQALGQTSAEAMAAMFTADGELSWADDPPIRGPAAILAHLRRFESYRVEATRMTPETARVSGSAARQDGVFWQRTRLPDGTTVEASGRFTAEWALGEDGRWRLRRLATRPP
jgi:uncharacterized protein (TIGR02246 family)